MHLHAVHARIRPLTHQKKLYKFFLFFLLLFIVEPVLLFPESKDTEGEKGSAAGEN